MKLSSVVVRRFKVINSYRWGTTYNPLGQFIHWPTLVEHIRDQRQLKELSNDYDLLSAKRFCYVTFLCQIMMNVICNFQNSSTRHRRLVPDYASCPSYFIPNLITSSCAIYNISPRQIRGLQTIKRMDCGHCCGDISINCSCNPTGTEWWPHILSLFLTSFGKFPWLKTTFQSWSVQ